MWIFRCPSFGPLSELLDAVCTQFDAGLDRDQPVFPDSSDQLAEAINNTRSRGLESLVKFGLQLKRQGNKNELPHVRQILEKRLTQEPQIPLTLPEYAILGLNYGRLLSLDETWAMDHRSDVFPQGILLGWRSAFGTLLRYTHPNGPMFNVLKEDFAFALQHLADLESQDSPRDAFADTLGRHLFTYYLWDLYPLKGPGCLMEQFYQRTGAESGSWGNLFDHIGFTLRNTGKHLEKPLKDRLTAFFEWRFEVGDPNELSRFSLWLESECLEEGWRLDAFSRILDISLPEGRGIYGQVETLNNLLPNHTARVVECFAKLTDKLENDSFHIMTEPAKRIMKAGISSSDAAVHADAERARNNLLRKGRFDLLSLDD